MNTSNSNVVHAFKIADAAKEVRHVFIHDLILTCLIGVHKHERKKPQRIRINLDLAVTEQSVISTDRLTDVVCYEDVGDRIRSIVNNGHVNLVETLAEKIASKCLEDRRIKAWSYNTMKQRTEIQNRSWEILKHRNEGWQDDLDKDNYFRQLRTRLNSAFYTENTESVGNYDSLDKKFDIIFSPTAGYSTEVLVEKLNFDGDIVFYDYSEENLDIKQNIVEMNMSMDEIRTYSQISDHVFSFNVGNKYSEVMRERAKTYGDLETLRVLQKKMRDTHNIEYWLMDLVCPTIL